MQTQTLPETKKRNRIARKRNRVIVNAAPVQNESRRIEHIRDARAVLVVSVINKMLARGELVIVNGKIAVGNRNV